MLALLGHPFAFALWVSARLLLVHAATMECEVDTKIAFFISTLEQMGQQWQVAREYARILNDVLQEGSTGAGRTFTAMRR
jgi:ubiquinone biosynthesis protein UbiJ